MLSNTSRPRATADPQLLLSLSSYPTAIFTSKVFSLTYEFLHPFLKRHTLPFSIGFASNNHFKHKQDTYRANSPRTYV